ncbi:MAG: DUF4838 domain-containing protein, partial [Kiritimatiellia bacterium]
LPEHAIWVGCQPVLDKLFPEIDFNFRHPEEILIAANENHLVVAGRDVWDRERIVTYGHPRRGRIPGAQAEFGTVNAVYTFLRDWLDVRWLWPGETGTDIIPKERIAFEPFEYRYHPQFRGRSGVLVASMPTTLQGYAHTDWSRVQRVFFDSLYGYPGGSGGHGFNDWWDRFHESHPEFFALQPDGTRSGYPGPGRQKMCQNNPGVWEQWLADVEARIEENPNVILFAAGISDNHPQGHCVCENCRAWDEPDAPPRRLMWQGLSQEYVSLSDRDVRFANELARLLRERFPTRDDYSVSILAYGAPTLEPPIKAVPDEKIVVAYVGNVGSVDRNCPDGTTTVDEQIAGWAATGAKIIFRPNWGGIANDLTRGQMPAVFFGEAMELFRFWAEHNGIGVYIDWLNEAWPTQGPLYYLLAHLAWDPYADGYAILDDYYRRGFGPAHEQLKAYWTFMEDTRNARVAAGLSHDIGWRAPGSSVYDEGFFRYAGGLLDEAETLLAAGPDIYRRRLAHVRAGLEFTRLMVDTANHWDRYIKSKKRDEEAAARVRANWEEIMPIARRQMIYQPRLNSTRNDMHPDGEFGLRDWKAPGDGRLNEFDRVP